jgi:polyphenol oxidase
MSVPAPFEQDGDHFSITLHGARALFTTRRGGVSQGRYATLNLGLTDPAAEPGDSPAAIAENRAILAGLTGASVVRIHRQVHGAEVATAGAAADAADGLATSARGDAVAVHAADCLPIAIAGRHAVAVVHGGWRGLAAGVVANGVAAVRALGDEGPLMAAVGPGAGRCCYEAGEEVRAAFRESVPAAIAGSHVDLRLIARAQLEREGVAAVHDIGLCTICADPALFFSHRRDGGLTGRQAGVAWLI